MRVGLGAVADMGGIMIEIAGMRLVEQFFRRSARGLHDPAQQAPRPVADHRPDHLFRQRPAPEIGQHPVDPAGNIGGGVGQGAVQVEGDDVEGKGGHGPPAIHRYGNGKLSVAFAAP